MTGTERVRAYEGRGYRMLEGWEASARAVEDGVADEDAG